MLQTGVSCNVVTNQIDLRCTTNEVWESFSFLPFLVSPHNESLWITWNNFSPVSIHNHMHSKVWYEITYPIPNFDGCTVEVWEWKINFIPNFIMDVDIYRINKKAKKKLAIADCSGTYVQFAHVNPLYCIVKIRVVCNCYCDDTYPWQTARYADADNRTFLSKKTFFPWNRARLTKSRLGSAVTL